MTRTIVLLNGPNLNLLGQRKTDVYGFMTLQAIEETMREKGKELGLNLLAYQTNIEGEIVDSIQKAQTTASGIIINAAAYTHYSIAIRDALIDSPLPAIEVHLSNIYARETFRHQSMLAPVVKGQISGFGPYSYILALQAMAHILNSEGEEMS